MEMLDQLRTRYWDDNEVRELLALWGDERVQRELDGTRRDNQVFIRLSDSLRCKGIYRSPAQVREKIKILKREYRVCLNVLHENGRLPAKYKYFEYMRAILGGPTTGGAFIERPDSSPLPNRCEPEVIIDQDPHGEALLIPKSEPRRQQQNGRGGPDSPDNSESEDHYGGGIELPPLPPRIHEASVVEGVLDRFLAFLKESSDRFYDLEEKRMRHERELEEIRQQREASMFERLCQMARRMSRPAKRGPTTDEETADDEEAPKKMRKKCRCGRKTNKTDDKAVQTCD